MEHLPSAPPLLDVPVASSTPLTIVLEAGQVDRALERIMSGDENINDTNNILQESPLHVAARKGYAPIVRELLRSGAVNIRDATGRTPLDYARDAGHEEIVELLTHKRFSKKPKELRRKRPDLKDTDQENLNPAVLVGWGAFAGLASFLLYQFGRDK